MSSSDTTAIPTVGAIVMPENAPHRNEAQHSHPERQLSPTSIHAQSEQTLRRDSTPIDRIETGLDEANDKDESNEHPSHLAETFKKATSGVKRKMYLHHRHQRDLGRVFTPGSAWKHLPWSHSKKIQDNHEADVEAQTPSGDDERRLGVFQNIVIMFTTFPYWNMAFWSGFCYSIGSAMFVIDGAWSWTPQQWPSSEFHNESEYAIPLMFFFGACLYQIGGVMAYLEAVNDGSFAGAAMKKLFQGHQDIEKEFLDTKLHTFFGHIVPHHHHDDVEKEKEESDEGDCHWDALQTRHADPEEVYAEAQANIAKTQSKKTVDRRGGISDERRQSNTQGEVSQYLTWRWWPTWEALRSYHVFELGYLACAIQLFGVTLYGVTSIVILPGIFDTLEWWQELAAYWYPALIASCCFLIASIMFTIMAQEKWNRPKGRAVSWWIGIWAIAGSVGFLLNAVFGILANSHPWAEYQSSLSTTWGSFFYMLSGLFQWYEAINVNVGPVLAFPNNRTPVLLRSKP